MALRPRADWHMPPKPVAACPVCGGDVVAEATLDEEDGWRLFWACVDCQCDLWVVTGIYSEIEWPFDDDDVCNEDDLVALGFAVTEEWVHA